MHHFCPAQPLRKVKTDLKSARRDAFSGVSGDARRWSGRGTAAGRVVGTLAQQQVGVRLGATSWAPSTPTVARPGRHVRAVDQGERRDVAERVVDRHRRLPAAAARAHASGSSRGSAVASGRRGAASLPVARKRLGGACGLGGGAFESSRAPGKRQEAAGGCRRSEIVLQQRRDVGRRSRRRAASWSSIDKRDSQRCSGTTCRRGGPGATARSGLPTTAHHRTRPQALIPHLETTSARECSTTRKAASTGLGA